ncbi:hypothetical protein FQA39_LY07041 [Lamprigera yunnana]|nr:hypothetical protein FQA39_LY07041 [Lamprigera yunnana]
MKNLLQLTKLELKSFFNSFDTVLCDCDGVLWFMKTPFEGVKEGLAALKQNGKNVYFVSNNSTHGAKPILRLLNNFDSNFKEYDFVIPSQAMISYFKEINMKKKLFIMGTDDMKQDFVDAGFSLAQTDDIDVTKTTYDFIKGEKPDEDVGACILDVDLKINYAKLTKTTAYLQNEDVLFVVGASEKCIPISKGKSLIGPCYFEEIIEDITNRKSLRFGKPSLHYNKFIQKKYNICESSRVLFIGDSMEQDIRFGLNSGYQTLLVLTGLTKLEDIKDQKNSLPNYYINSLADFHYLIKNNVDA